MQQAAPLAGATEPMIGGAAVGLLLLLSGSLEPVLTISNRNVIKQIVIAHIDMLRPMIASQGFNF
jgi:hypothetical protein